jgi:hypothetical protein
MSTHRVVHSLAIISLLVVAGMSVISSLRSFPGAAIPDIVLTPIFAVAIWSWLILKIWKRPRQWGLGVGIFLLLLILFQTYLWRRSIASSHPETDAERYSTVGFILYELPLFVAAVCCLRLRFRDLKD